MRKFTTLAAAAALTTTALAAMAAPAAAQDRGWRDRPAYDARADYRTDGYRDDGLRDRIGRLDRWIDGARDSGRLAPWQARNAMESLRTIRERERDLRWRQGRRLRGYQVQALNDRLDGLTDFMRRAMRDDGGRRW